MVTDSGLANLCLVFRVPRGAMLRFATMVECRRRAPRATSFATLAIALWVIGCGNDPAPALSVTADASDSVDSTRGTDARTDVGGRDASPPIDSGQHDDAATMDATSLADASDTGSNRPDGMSTMGGDASVDGGGAGQDATVDAGPAYTDGDGDTISDADEGHGLVDTDGDGIPDDVDLDSDNDLIPDRIEAGDTDPLTPPVDTDGDGVPDFRDTDSDGDGVFDVIETAADTDGDGIPNFRDPDSDGDGILDGHERAGDPDNDGIPSFLDDDSDGDGILDAIERADDADGDGTPNYLDLDSDGDGIDDAIELLADPDGDGIPAFLDLDSDGDGLLDMDEATADSDGDGLGNWLDSDSDNDTIRDGDDGVADIDNDGLPNYLDVDSDGDGIPDAVEAGDSNPLTPPVDFDFDRIPDFVDPDSDNDTILDLHEGIADSDMDGIADRHDIDSDNDGILDDVEAGDRDPLTPPIDSDGDGLPNAIDVDSDGDTILDIAEGTSDPDGDMVPNYLDEDSDNDGWTDALEAGDTDPTTAPVDSDGDTFADFLDLDSDNDGLRDGDEPGCPGGPSRLLADSDSDGFLDPAEVAIGTDPCSGASIIDDFYFVLPPGGPGDDAPLAFTNTEIDRADIVFNVDNTGSMQGEITNMQSTLSGTIIPAISTVIPDSGFGVSAFEDYPIEPFGMVSFGDEPFHLLTRVTTDAVTAQTAVDAMTLREGGDQAESGIEALYQIATGVGTSWPGGSVAAFDSAVGRVPGVADGELGGVGFRDGALPIVVHITDAQSHIRSDYARVSTQIAAADVSTVQTALAGLGIRVITVTDHNMAELPADPFTDIISGAATRVFGEISPPLETDVDWFELDGTAAGDVVTAESYAFRLGSGHNTNIAVFNATSMLASNLNFDFPLHTDSQLSVTLSGPGPYYFVMSAWRDDDFDGVGGRTEGFYFFDLAVNGVAYTTASRGCRLDDGNNRATASQMVPAAMAMTPTNTMAALVDCQAHLDPFSTPNGMSQATGAMIPPCAWDAFGGGRPVGCAPGQCCTGIDGVSVAPLATNGLCPLAFRVRPNGQGLDTAIVAAVEALASATAFTVTTRVRPDPVELAASGLDTTCFIHGVVPVRATPNSACAPQPTAVDLEPPSPELDSWENVFPGTDLEFQVNALNVDRAVGTPCRDSVRDPQVFRAFIDLVADGITVLDTRDVVIIVPGVPPGQNQ